MELQGKVIVALPARSGVSQRGEWKSQEFVIEYQEGQYPRRLCFNVFGEERLQRFNIQVGQYVSVSFDIDAREWNGRWFTDIRAYDVRLADPNANQPGMAPVDAPVGQAVDASSESNPPAPFPPQQAEEGTDNLPF